MNCFEVNRRRTQVLFEAVERRQLMASTPALGPELVLPGDTAPALSVGSQTNPTLAEGPNGVSLAVWQDTRSGGNPNVFFGTGLGTMTDIYAARVRADGSVIDVTPIPVSVASYNQEAPKAAWNGTNWLVAWNTERDNDFYETDINAVRISPNGVVLDQNPMVIGTHAPNPQGSNDFDPTGPLGVISDGQDWVVTYERHDPTIGGGIGMRWFAVKVLANGVVPDQEGVNYFTANQYSDDIGWAYSPVNGGEYLQASGNSGQITITRYTRDLTVIAGSERTMSAQGITRFNVAGGPTGWIMGWNYTSAWEKPQAVRIGSDGNFIDQTPLDVTDWQYASDTYTDVAWNGTDWTFAFTGYDPNQTEWGDGVWTRRIDPTATGTAAFKSANKHITPGSTNGVVSPTVVGSGDGGFKAMYTDLASTKPGIAISVVSPTDVLLNRADVSLAAPTQTSADLASDGQNFLMVFNSSNAFGTRLLAQRVTPAGVALDQEPVVIAEATEKPGTYEVVFLNGKYLVLYQAETGPAGKQIYARSVGVDGTVGTVTTLMSTTPGVGFNLSDTSVSNDRLIVIGNSSEGQNHRSSRFFRVFSDELQPISARTQIDYGFATGGDTEPVSGGWMTAWQSKLSHDNPRASVLYAVIALDGSLIKPTTSIAHTWPYHSNGVPTVTSNGGEAGTEAMVMFTQTLDPVNPVGTAEGIRAQRVAFDGTFIGETITLIDEPGVQTQPSAVFDGTNYVMTWTDQRNYAYPQQARDDIFAARVAVDGTVLDPGGFPVADTFRPEMHGDVAVAGGQVMFAYRTFRHEAPWGAYRLAARQMNAEVGATLSTVNQPGFQFETDQAVAIVFNKPLLGVDSADLRLTNTTTGQTVPSSQLTVETVPASTQGWTYRWKFTGGVLADGVYTATLPAGTVTDFSGRANAADITVNFEVFAGDADRNGIVDIGDFSRLATRFNQSGTFSQGDFNYDRTVNIADFAILAGKFNTTLPSARAASSAAASLAPSRISPFATRQIEEIELSDALIV